MSDFHSIYLLQKELTALQSNAEVRRLLSLVVQDAQNETIDLEESAKKVVERPMKLDTKLALFELRSFLQLVYFWLEYEAADMGEAFLYENHTRLQKMLVVAKLLDHVNLQSFGTPDSPVHPMPSDIPTYARLWNMTIEFRKAELANHHVLNQQRLADMPRDFKYLCPADDRKAFEARGDAELGQN
jgi:hypothetical protein